MAQLTLEEAYAKWSPDVVSYAAALVGPDDAADVVADAFARLVDGGAAVWAAVREPRAFLFTATLNAARMHHRGRIRRERREWRCTASTTPTNEWLGDPAIVRALARLSLQQRAVTYLTYWEDLDVVTVASRLGIGTGTVKRQLARARSRLREVLS
jgi:RNA polymerase sigma factor (sigma-70 family)